MNELQGKKVLVLAGPAFEDRELFYPYYRFLEAGATVKVAGLGENTYTGKAGLEIDVDDHIDKLASERWDIVTIPGGWAPDKIRMNPNALAVVQKTLEQNGTVAAICHAGWVLCSANVIRGRRVTSYKAIKDDMINAGGEWTDQEVVIDKTQKGILITSRTPDDLPAYCREIIAAQPVGVPA